jgi:hypothetical protein
MTTLIKESTTPPKQYSFGGSTCFAKGTLVHTKEGLVPIEKIKVGDWVRSRPEDGSVQVEYKRVTQTFAHAPTQIVNLWYRCKEEQNQFSKLTTTLNHPFWVVGRGWTEVSDLDLWPGQESQLELMDGRRMLSTNRKFILKTSIPNVGWICHMSNSPGELGTEWDFENNVIYRRDVVTEDFIEDFGRPYELMPDHPNLFTAPVYNIEVEDFHTCFVGKEGVWVHNKNVSTAPATMNGEATALSDGRRLSPNFRWNGRARSARRSPSRRNKGEKQRGRESFLDSSEAIKTPDPFPSSPGEAPPLSFALDRRENHA